MAVFCIVYYMHIVYCMANCMRTICVVCIYTVYYMRIIYYILYMYYVLRIVSILLTNIVLTLRILHTYIVHTVPTSIHMVPATKS